MLRRSRYGGVIDRQLDLFVADYPDVLREADDRLALYNAADRDEAEELYGDYVDAVETGTEILADVRDHYASSMTEDDGERYIAEFNRAVAQRLPRYAPEIENR